MTAPRPGARKGRPPTHGEPMAARVAFRVTAATAKALAHEAKRLGVTPGEVARDALLARLG